MLKQGDPRVSIREKDLVDVLIIEPDTFLGVKN